MLGLLEIIQISAKIEISLISVVLSAHFQVVFTTQIFFARCHQVQWFEDFKSMKWCIVSEDL